MNLSAPFISAFPIAGAAVSVMAGPRGQSTMYSSDRIADRLDELQFDLGEGPCWTAIAERTPVLRSNIRSDGNTDWPAFTEAVLNDAITGGVSSIFAFPLMVGALDIGAIDLYGTEYRGLAPTEVAEASALASLAAWQVLRRILDDHDQLYDTESLGYARREVHQATGMVIVQLGVSPEDAELLLRAHAFSSGRSLRDVANDVVERTLDFTPQPSSTTPE
ncbi:MAG: antitermination regulatory protein containing a sensor domain [Rhodoglobus sp.]|nr:antitermination regulatory protein containing a sensor domain [Rhodoglobus sp.]